MGYGFKFVYPAYTAKPAGVLPQYEQFSPKIRTQNLVPGDAIGHIWSDVRQAFLCNKDLTRSQVAKSAGCKKVTAKDNAIPGRTLCPECQAIYLKSNDREAARFRAWQDKEPLRVKDGCFE